MIIIIIIITAWRHGTIIIIIINPSFPFETRHFQLWFFYGKNFGIFGPLFATFSEEGAVIYKRHANHFLKKIIDLDGLPEGAILCTVDVVGLYPSIPHEEGLEALKGVLEHREDKPFPRIPFLN